MTMAKIHNNDFFKINFIMQERTPQRNTTVTDIPQAKKGHNPGRTRHH
jgi:hypothetical protein